MRVGLMSDTHDNLEATREAIETFNSEKVERVLHAGDMISPFTVSEFSVLEADFHYVWGNNDGDKEHLSSSFEELGVEPASEFKVLELDGRKIALLHGTDEEIVTALAESGRYDAVVRGHTHEPEIQEDPLIINPGAASGYLSYARTVAVLDTEDMKAEILEF